MFLRNLRSLKTFTKEAVYRTMPISWWGSRLNYPLLVPVYHLVSDERVPHVRNLYHFRSVHEFERDLDFLLRNFEPVGLDTVIDSVNCSTRPRRQRFHLTFDDGFREQHEIIAPLLLRKGVPASFYLATTFLNNTAMAHRNKVSLVVDRVAGGISKQLQREIEEILTPGRNNTSLVARMLAIPWTDRARVDRIAEILGIDVPEYLKTIQPYLSFNQVRNLIRQGFEVGAHSCDHPYYADISLPDQLAQTRGSVNLMASLFGTKVRAFAFPFGDEHVTPQFFESVFHQWKLDVTFGTNGLIPHFNPRNIPRVVMERTAPVGTEIIKDEYMRAFQYRRG